MKIALCFYGQFGKKNINSRFGYMTKEQYNSIDNIWSINHYKKYVIQNYDVDVFFHCWNEEHKDFLVKHYNPKSYLFEKQNKKQQMWGENNNRSIKNNNPRLISEQKSFRLVLTYEKKKNFKYDLVFHTIFDQLFFTKINFNKLNNEYIYTSIRYMKNDLLLKKTINQFYDQWYIGKSEYLKHFIGDKVLPYFQKYKVKDYGSHIQRYKLVEDLGLINKFKYILYPGTDHNKVNQIFCSHYIHNLKKIIS